jgi:hypothetical protein
MLPDYKKLLMMMATIFVIAVVVNTITLISLTLVIIENHL